MAHGRPVLRAHLARRAHGAHRGRPARQHPGAGQGTSLAVEDAVVLAQCLRDLPVTAVFARFERLRRRRVERVVALAAKTCAPTPANPVARQVRDAAMRLALGRATRRGKDSLGWVHQHHLDWDTPTGPHAH